MNFHVKVRPTYFLYDNSTKTRDPQDTIENFQVSKSDGDYSLYGVTV